VEGTSYQIMPGDSKFFLYAEGTRAGETQASSFCFTNPSSQGFVEYQGLPYPVFTFSFNLDTNFKGQSLQVTVSLSKPAAALSFNNHQPFVDLVDQAATGPTVDLTPVTVWDGDGNLDTDRFLWFENFEASTERFLGKGQTLNDVSFSHGQHEITLVAYDTDGSYNSDTMILTIEAAPVAYADGPFTVDEDSVLSVETPGVLDNDTDAENDPLTAVVEGDPANGTLNLNADGSFTYTPNPNFTGTDSFTYRANDGAQDSGPATVTITVVEVPEDQETEDLADMVTDLVEAGALNPGQGKSLIAGKLDQAIAKMKAGQTKIACNLYQAFINEVNSLIEEGVLLVSEGQPLIEKAENIMEELGCK
jgi:VCBS repeat-containing protein